MAGIEIRVHPTFLVLIVLAAVGGLGPPADGLLWLVLVFASVVFHELSHSLVARQRGIGVRDILLLPIGGVSELERLPSRPADQAAIAVAGPAASFVLAAVAASACATSGHALLPVDLLHGAVLHRLAWMNVFLGGFNLLPAFPLDGGRLLRAWLAGRMPPEEATVRAARLGRALAVALAVFGFLTIDLWLLLIAGFVYVGSRAEEAVTVIHARLAGLTVADVMVRAPITVDAGMTPDAIEWLRRATTQRQIPVTSGNAYVGLLDLDKPVSGAKTVGEAADARPTARSDEPLSDAFDRLLEAWSVAAAVLDDQQAVVGLLFRADISGLFSERGAA